VAESGGRVDPIEKAYNKLSKNARAWFEDFQFSTRSADHLREFFQHTTTEEFDQRFRDLPRNQQKYLDVLITARRAQLGQAELEAAATYASILHMLDDNEELKRQVEKELGEDLDLEEEYHRLFGPDAEA
jgi:hypothetical protein